MTTGERSGGDGLADGVFGRPYGFRQPVGAGWGS